MSESDASMRAVIMERIGKPRVLKATRLARPQPGSGEVLVKVHATSVNPVDLMLRSGRFIVRKPMPHILGADLAGEIAQLGEDAGEWQRGDRVCACFEGLGSAIDGGYAEFCVLPADQLIALPNGLDYQSAAAAGAAFAAAFQALVINAKLKKADTVVIRGASGSVGAAAVQITAARGAQVIAISESRFVADLRGIGADIVLEDAGDDLARQVKVATRESGASLVLHCSQQLDLDESLDMLCPGGRLVIAGALAKPQAKLNAMDLYLRNLSIIGANSSIRPKDYESLLGSLAKGKYQALVQAVMPLSRARQAHQKLEKSAGFGKIVLAPDAVLAAAKQAENRIPIE